MKSTVYYSKRKFTTEEHTGREKKPVYDFTELIKALKAWK